MAYTTINKSSLHMNTKLYTGTGSSLALTGVGFQPDWVWIKNRAAGSGLDHILTDSVRGATKVINTNDNSADDTVSNALTAFDADGFTVNGNGSTGANGDTYAAWCWKAGTTGPGTSTGSGYGKAYSYSVNTTAGFSVIKYIGNGTAGHTLPHHLGAVPEWILVKDLDATVNWQMYHVITGNTHTTEINITNAPFSSNSRWNNTTPSSTVVTFGDGNNVNNNNTNYIMYAFAPKTGYSKFGGYTGNGSTDGPFVYTGFKPSFVMTIRQDGTSGRGMLDNKRPGYNPTNLYVLANTNDLEQNDGSWTMDLLSNGWKARYNNGNFNANGGTYFYMAFGQSIVGTNNIPATAR